MFPSFLDEAMLWFPTRPCEEMMFPNYPPLEVEMRRLSSRSTPPERLAKTAISAAAS